MKTIIFCVVISLVSAQDGYQGYLCKTDKNEKELYTRLETYQKGDTIWINNQNCN